MQDLPRPVPRPDPARRWKPDRPGEISGPAESKWGGAYGTPGPDTGYVLRLIHHRNPAIPADEDHHDMVTALAALASARASANGRAPIMADVEVATILLGLDPDTPEGLAESFRSARMSSRFANLSHRADRRRALVAAVPPELLGGDLADVRKRVSASEWMLES